MLGQAEDKGGEEPDLTHDYLIDIFAKILE